jgi:hypothetical protein
VTSVILVAGRVAGVWDFVPKPSPELPLLFFESPDDLTRRRVRALAAEVGEFLTDGSADVAELDRMPPLTDRTVGRFLSPRATRFEAAGPTAIGSCPCVWR